MNTIDVVTLPKIKFAHVYSTEHYAIDFSRCNQLIEVTHIADGTVTIHKDGETLTASAGDILCFIRDTAITISSDNFHCHHTVCADAQWITCHGDDGLFLPLITKASSETENIAAMIDTFIYEPYRYEYSCAKGGVDFLNILCRIDAHYRQYADTRRAESHLLARRAKRYIYQHIHQPISQNEVAEHLGITPQYLCSVFKKSEGTSLIKYVNTAKLKGVQSLMEKEHIKLYEAAQMYGFSDANYVSYLYKKTFGRSITAKPNTFK